MNQTQKIRESIKYIEKNLCEKIQLNEIAKQSFFSKFHFHRLFHEATGKSVMQYIRLRRLSEAAAELNDTDAKITDIAFKYQFSSEESFSRAFKRAYGKSPREYRQNRPEIYSSSAAALQMAA